MSAGAGKAQRNLSLETLRGLAALVVVGWHVMLALWPVRAGIFPGDDPALRWNGAWWFGLLNGPAAVTFFFVLSGFVLTRRALLDRAGLPLARGALKRWPRLAGPVLVTVLFSWALFALDAYAYVPAAALTGSPWLATFGYTHVGVTFVPSLWEAVTEGTYGTFLFGTNRYDTVLWTMRPEFVGSFLAFGTAALLLWRRAAPGVVRVLVLVVAALLCWYLRPSLLPFVAGVALAALLPARLPRLPWLASAALLATALLLAGISGEFPRESWPARLGLALPGAAWPFHAAAALLALLAVLCCPALAGALSGPAAALLGRLSFPLYLLHAPVLFSAGAAALLGATRAGWASPLPEAAAVLTTLLLTFLLSLPLAAFDVRWAAWLGGVARWLLPKGTTWRRRPGVPPSPSRMEQP